MYLPVVNVFLMLAELNKWGKEGERIKKHEIKNYVSYVIVHLRILFLSIKKSEKNIFKNSNMALFSFSETSNKIIKFLTSKKKKSKKNKKKEIKMIK